MLKFSFSCRVLIQRGGSQLNYDVLVTTKDSTVVAEYKPIEQNSVTYQSEEALEKEFIKNLKL